MNNRVYKNDIMELAKNIETQLVADGFEVSAKPYFAYGKYGYYFDFNESDMSKVRQIKVGLGTKKECFNELSRVYLKVSANREYYLGN